jgi:hypothetical protein
MVAAATQHDQFSIIEMAHGGLIIDLKWFLGANCTIFHLFQAKLRAVPILAR